MVWATLVSVDYTEILFSHWEALLFLFLVPLIFLLGKVLLGLYMWLHHRDFDLRYELVEADNLAVCVALTGMQMGLALTAWGALSDQDKHNNAKNLYGSIGWFLIGVIFMAIFYVFTDKLTLRSAHITAQTRKGNVASALCAASNFVSSGIVALYTIGGGVDRWDEAVGSAILFFILCRVFLSLFHLGIMFIFRRFGNLEEEVRSGNIAAGVLLFTIQTGVSIFVTNPLRSSEEVLAFFVWCIIAGIVVVIVDALMWFVIVTKDGTDEFKARHWGGAFVEGCGVIAASLAIIPFLPNTCAYTAQLTMSFNDRLGSTETTRKLFQWMNLYYVFLIVFFLSSAKVIFILPYLYRLPPTQWLLAIRFFLAAPGDMDSMCRSSLGQSPSTNHSQLSLVNQQSSNFSDSAELGTEISMSTGKVRGRKNHLLKEVSGFYAKNNEEAAIALEGGSLLPPPALHAREVEPVDIELQGQAESFDDDALRAQPSTNVASQRKPKVRKDAGTLSEPLAAEASIDFSSMVADGGTAFESKARISEARAVSFGGFLLSIGLLLRASFATTIGSAYLQVHEVLIYTLFWISASIVMLLTGSIVQSLLLWGRFAPPSRTNLASGIILFSLFISVSLQASSSIMANQVDGPFDLTNDFPQALVLFLIQMALVGASGFAFQYLTTYDDRKAVEEGNVAAAVANGGAMIASALIASAPTTKTSELLTFVVYFIIGSVFVHVSARQLTGFFFGNRSTDDEVAKDGNWGAASLEASIAIGAAYAYSALLPELCSATAVAATTIVNTNTTTTAP